MTDEDRKTKIIEAVENALADGYELHEGSMGVIKGYGAWEKSDDNSLCPLGAVCLNQDTTTDSPYVDAQAFLDVDSDWIRGFWRGFDDTWVGADGTRFGIEKGGEGGYDAGKAVAEHFLHLKQ